MKLAYPATDEVYVATVEQPAHEDVLLPQGAHPLVAEIRRLAVATLEERVDQMIRSADEVLIAMSETAATPAQQHAHLDTIRVLQFEQGPLTRQFHRELERAFDINAAAAPPAVAGHQALLPEQEMEENVAWSRIAARCKTRHKDQLELLEPRISELALNMSLPLSMRMFAPARIGDAWRACLDPLDLGFNVRRILVKLFEQMVMDDLSGFYAAILSALDRHDGRRPAPSRVTAAPAASIPAGAGTRVLRALQAVAAGSAHHSAVDLRLALDVIACLRTQPGGAVSQRAGLVGSLLGEFTADPHLPKAYASTIEGWFFPLLKAALSDDSFFSNSAQPVRQLLSQQMLQAVTARIEGPLAFQRTGAQLKALSDSFAVSAEFARPALAQRALLRPADVASFLQQLQADGVQRRAELLSKTRRVVAQALESRILGRPLPPALDEIMRSGIGPMLARRLLRDGFGSAAWNEAVARVGQLLDSACGAEGSAGRGAVVATLISDLKEAGLDAQRIGLLVGGLRGHFQQLDQQPLPAAPEPAAATAAASNDPLPEQAHLMLQLFQPGQWFQVYDPVRSQSCWMKFVSYLQQQNSISFIDFSGQKTLKLRAGDFVADLKTRRSGPVGASAGVQQALARLIAA